MSNVARSDSKAFLDSNLLVVGLIPQEFRNRQAANDMSHKAATGLLKSIQVDAQHPSVRKEVAIAAQTTASVLSANAAPTQAPPPTAQVELKVVAAPTKPVASSSKPRLLTKDM